MATIGEVPSEAVLAALEKMIASEDFGKSARRVRLLRYLVETALRGESHLLKESVLGTDVFDRPATWDPRLEPVVRQEVGRLRKQLAKYYENSGSDDEIRIELPVGAYVPAFRWKPAAIETPPVKNPLTEQAPARARRIWLYAAAGILCVASAPIAWRAPGLLRSQPSIAVLPFTDLNGDPASQYFADGLTDEITDSLARLNSLRVIARSSAFQFKGKTVDIREVGRLLNVANVVEGSVERSGNRIKIIAHLERVSDRTLLWSNAYERNASDLFSIQSEVAAGIAGNLKVATGIPAARHVPNPEAQDLVMKARYEVQQMTADSLTRAESDFQSAIGLDPEYAGAYLGLASAKYNRFLARGSSYQTDAERKSAEQLFHKALSLDPESPTAHAMLAVLALQFDWDWAGAERELQLATAGPSNATAEAFYAFFLVFRGRFAEADRHARLMQELDPFSTSTLNNLGVVRHHEGRFAEAREIGRQLAAQSPNMIAAQQLIGGVYIEEGHPQLALPIFRELEHRFPQIRLFEAMAYAKAGERDKALQLTRPFEDAGNSGISFEWIAFVYALLGDEPNTVKWLQRSADRHEWQALAIGVHPVFAPMRNSPGFQALKKRMGLDH